MMKLGRHEGLINLSAMARNPIVESPKFGENPFNIKYNTPKVHVTIGKMLYVRLNLEPDGYYVTNGYALS